MVCGGVGGCKRRKRWGVYKQFNNLTQGASSLLEDEEVQPVLKPALHLNSKYSLEYPKAYSLDHKNLKILKKKKKENPNISKATL